MFPPPPVRFPLHRVGAVAVVMALLTAVPAAAHPFVRGGEAPVDSLATLTLAMAHGCGAEGGGEERPTTEVALQVPEWMRVVDVPAKQGWTVERETDEGGAVRVVSWQTEDPVEPAPEFDLEAVVTGEPGEERFLEVFQGCGEAEHRWIGVPDEPAEDPAVRLTLAPADPGRPVPEPEPAGEQGGPADGGEQSAPPGDAGVAEGAEQSGEPADPDPPPEPDAVPDPEPAEGGEEATSGTREDPGLGEETPGSDDALAQEPDAAADPGVEDGGASGWLLAAVAVLAVLGGGAAAWRARHSRTGRTG